MKGNGKVFVVNNLIDRAERAEAEVARLHNIIGELAIKVAKLTDDAVHYYGIGGTSDRFCVINQAVCDASEKATPDDEWECNCVLPEQSCPTCRRSAAEVYGDEVPDDEAACSGCQGASLHHTCGKQPDAYEVLAKLANED